MIDETLLDLYSARMKDLGAAVRDDRPLPEGVVAVRHKRRSPLCGSQVAFDIAVDADTGRVAEVGYVVRACALSAAATAIVVQNAPGSDLAELRAVRDAVRAMLKGESEELPGGKWQDLEILRPAQMVKARHGSAMLPFDTMVEALERVASDAP